MISHRTARLTSMGVERTSRSNLAHPSSPRLSCCTSLRRRSSAESVACHTKNKSLSSRLLFLTQVVPRAQKVVQQRATHRCRVSASSSSTSVNLRRRSRKCLSSRMRVVSCPVFFSKSSIVTQSDSRRSYFFSESSICQEKTHKMVLYTLAFEIISAACPGHSRTSLAPSLESRRSAARDRRRWRGHRTPRRRGRTRRGLSEATVACCTTCSSPSRRRRSPTSLRSTEAASEICDTGAFASRRTSHRPTRSPNRRAGRPETST